MLKLFLKITGLNTKFCSLFFFFVYNHNKQEFYLADCGTVNGYAERYCFNEELGYIGPSLIAEVNGVSGVVKGLDIFLKEAVL